MERNDYTVTVFKSDRRSKKGERLVKRTEHTNAHKETLDHLYRTTYFSRDGFRIEIRETYVTRKNLMSGAEYKERFDTPSYCSPASEAYWSA
jgi:hypothetical protein